MNKAIVLWSGGKDCHLALYEALQEGYAIAALITFAPPNADFKTHPIPFMKRQAQALDLPHSVREINEPYAENYELQLMQLKIDLGMDTVISGDIAEVDENANWITERAKAVGLNVFLPLWQQERENVLQRLFDSKFEIILSGVKSPWLQEHHLGMQLNENLLAEFRELGTTTGMDLCGEQGEYHTMVVNAPMYKHPVALNSFTTTQDGDLWYMKSLVFDEPGKVERTKLCSQCNAHFSCYTQGCWCAELPMIVPLDNINDCLCPKCLKALIDKK